MPITAPTRREMLALAAGTALLPALYGIRPARADGATLGEIAARRGLAYGCMAEPRSVLDDAAAAALLAREATFITDAQFHWRYTTRAPGAEDLTRAERILAWAEMRKMPARGHALLWYLQTPEWWAEMSDRNAAREVLLTHVSKVVSQFSGRISSWDVVNEAIRVDDGRDDGLREGPFLDRFGANFIEAAFHAAHEADPAARLAYNDYGMEAGDRRGRAKRAALLHLLGELKRKNVPITTIGLQSHLDSGLPDFDPEGYRAFLREIAAHDVEIILTEMDVVDRDAPADIAARDAEVADTFRRFLDVALDEPRVSQVVTWGISDRYSWVADLSLKQFRRPDGQRPRPQLYDADLRPKVVRDAVAAALAGAPIRTRNGI